MADAFRRRLELRLESLESTILEAQTIIDVSTSEGVSEQDLLSLLTKLRNSIKNLNDDFCNFGGLINDNDFLNRITDTQINAENILTELDCLWKYYQKLQNDGHKNATKLPTLEIKKFNGDISQYHEYWDRFEASIANRNLNDVDKMTYLVSSLEGPALNAIRGLKICNQNYLIAVETLKKLYGNKDLQIDSHYDLLHNLTKAKYNSEECRQTLNSVEQHLRVLQSLGENIEGNHLRKIILDKFPEKIIYELNILKPNDKSITGIRQGLDIIISSMEQARVQENVNESFSTQVLTANTPARNSMKRKRTFQQTPDGPPNKKLKRGCIFCSQNHYNDECPLDLKVKKLKLKNRCFSCFREGHRINKCRSKKRCVHCKEPHNRALCPNRNKNMVTNEQTPTSLTVSSFCEQTVVLQTAVVNVHRNSNTAESVTCRALLDSGSQKSYLTRKIAEKLKCPIIEDNYLVVYTFGTGTPKQFHSPLINISIRTKTNKIYDIQVNIIKTITDKVAETKASLLQLIPTNMRQSIIIADENSQNKNIDLLIGNDYYHSFVHNEKIQLCDTLYIVNTDFGWIFSGRYNKSKTFETMSMITYADEISHSKVCNFADPDPPLKEDNIRQIWDLETIGITDSLKVTRDEEAIDNFNQTITYYDNRYFVKWPWTEFPPNLPDNLGIAYGRLRSLLKRSDRQTIKLYDATIREQEEQGVIEKVPQHSINSGHPVHYLPHHCILKEGKTTKLRIVYDASTRTKFSNSLNQCLYKGPLLLEDLIGIILRFRRYKYGIVADVEKAFLQIGLQEADRDVTRFLWVKNSKTELTDNNIIHYRFCRVPFGIISSPFILAATINYHLNKSETETVKTIMNNIYVDNLLVSVSKEEEAIKLYDDARLVFKEMSMNLREWQSNCPKLMSKVPDPESTDVNILGLNWKPESDIIKLKTDIDQLLKEPVETKRAVLKIVASVYDPCGFVSPILLSTKLFLQDLWRLKYKWDTKLTEELQRKWNEAVLPYKEINEIELPRSLIPSIADNQDNVRYELHCFSDSSLKAYTAVVYLRSINGDEVNVSFVMSKTRLKSLKEKDELKIPKLELLGALIGARLLLYIKKMLEIKIEKEILWTDSKIVIGWMNTQKLLSPFVARRIKEIKENPNLKVKYIPSEQNPADIGTRPLKTKLQNSIWILGPDFLKVKELQYSLFDTSIANIAGVEDLPDTEESTGNNKEVPITETVVQIDKNMSNETSKLIDLQKKYYPEEYKGRVTDLTRSLQLYKDDEGLLRCKGRFKNSSWNNDKKHPILLPKNDNFTLDLINKIHIENYHVGTSHVLAILREKYWVPKGRSQVQKAIHRCIQCRKLGGGPFRLPPMPDLPKERVTYNSPFSYTGMDYLGPLYVSTGQSGKEKVWVCIYTCLAIRAVHLEVVKDMTADECLLALRRFVATRGLPIMITSDNATQFKLTSEVLSKPFCIDNNIKWKFIPQLAPWYGGFYERLVSLVKHCLKRTLEKHLLTQSQIQTVIKEIESVLNTRPLTYVGTELEHVLKPIDFLHLGKPLIPSPSNEKLNEPVTETKQRLIEGWKKGKNVVNDFINMFVSQYLPSLREKRSSHKEPRVKICREPRIGEVVQIKSESPRLTWKVGKIKELIKSSDGHIRVAKVEITPNSVLTRSIAHLYPLELDELSNVQSKESPSQETDKEDIVSSTNDDTIKRPKRAAAIRARQLLRELSTQLFAIDN